MSRETCKTTETMNAENDQHNKDSEANRAYRKHLYDLAVDDAYFDELERESWKQFYGGYDNIERQNNTHLQSYVEGEPGHDRAQMS